MDEGVKTIVLCVLLAIVVFFIGASTVHYMKTKVVPFADLFSDWKGWVVAAVAIGAGGGLWYYLEKYNKA